MLTKKSSYFEKLKNPRWQKLRLEAMQAANFKCQSCADYENTLHVHHKEYLKGHEPWEYSVKQLTVLCESCHEIEHKHIDILKWVCSQANVDGPDNRTELAILIAGYMGIPMQEIETIVGFRIERHLSYVYENGLLAKQRDHDETQQLYFHNEINKPKNHGLQS